MTTKAAWHIPFPISNLRASRPFLAEMYCKLRYQQSGKNFQSLILIKLVTKQCHTIGYAVVKTTVETQPATYPLDVHKLMLHVLPEISVLM